MGRNFGLRVVVAYKGHARCHSAFVLFAHLVAAATIGPGWFQCLIWVLPASGPYGRLGLRDAIDFYCRRIVDTEADGSHNRCDSSTESSPRPNGDFVL